MSRQPRLNIAEGVYHVTQHGLERRDIVLGDEDRHNGWRLFDRHAPAAAGRASMNPYSRNVVRSNSNSNRLRQRPPP